MYRFVCLSILVSGAVGQIILPGVCNYADIGGFVTDLNITQILGTWNEIARIENAVQVGECGSATLTGRYDNVTLVGVDAVYSEVLNKTKSVLNGTLGADSYGSGLFYVYLNDTLEFEFVVQATNYSDYAIVYVCNTLTEANETANINATKLVMAWQYHRKASLSSSELASLRDIANINPDLNGTTWHWVSHNDTACGRNDGVSLAVPHVLVFLATLFIGRDFFSIIM